MGQVKNWLIELEDDAANLARFEFVAKHSEKLAEQVWDKMNVKDSRWDYACSSKEEREQALAEVALELEIAASQGR